MKVNPADKENETPQKTGVYAHLELDGSTLSESQRKLFEMMKKKEEEDKGKLDDIATKDDIKDTAGCPPDDEKEKPDTRGMYAKIAMIKNKLRSKGISNPVVMATMPPTRGQKLNMYGEETVEEGRRPPMQVKKMSELNRRRNEDKKREEGEEAANTERTPAKDDPSFSQEYKDNAKKAIEASKKKNKKPYNPYRKAPEGKKQATPTNMVPGKP